MRSALIRCLLFLAILFTGWSLWRALSPSTGVSAEPASSDVIPTASPNKRRTSSRPYAHSPSPSSPLPEASGIPEYLPETLSDARGRLRRTLLIDNGDWEGLRRRLLAEGAERLTWAPEGGYTASLTPEALARLAAIDGIRPKPARMPVSQALREVANELSPETRLRVTLVCADAEDRQATERAAKAEGRVELAADTAVVVHLTAEGLGNVLRQTGAGVLAADLRREGSLWAEASAPQGAAAATLPATFPLTGRGETIALMDTGCSGGPNAIGTEAFHPDLERAVRAFLPQPWWAMRTSQTPTDGTDRLGHGTAVAGILAGDGKASPLRQFRGVAPEAGLLIQNNAFGNESTLIVPPDLRTLFAEAYSQGARIHSNSWGPRQGGDAPYGLEAWAADTFAWEHPDFLILFAAGNAGPKPQSLAGGAAVAKNVLTVGALGADGQSPATFSSRGPTADGRTKPECLAPGENIVAPGPPPTHGYRVLSGTSMATPTVAGIAALLREWLRVAYDAPTPSAALVKAALLLGCEPVEGGGFGAVSPTRLFLPAGATTTFAEFTYGPTGTAWTAEVTLDVPGELSAVLAWTDAPADITATRPLVNELGLRLLDASGRPVETTTEPFGTAVRLRAQALPAGTYQIVAESLRTPLPDGSAALALRLPAPTDVRLIHVPVERMEPGTSVPLTFTTSGIDPEALRLEVSGADGSWAEAPQHRRLDAPREAGTFWYRLVAGERQWGPFAVGAADLVPLTVTDDGTGFVTTPALGTTALCAGEEVNAIAHDAWRWDISQAGYPRIEGVPLPVRAWRLTDDASGRTLAQGKGPEARFAMPKAPATLRWTR